MIYCRVNLEYLKNTYDTTNCINKNGYENDSNNYNMNNIHNLKEKFIRNKIKNDNTIDKTDNDNYYAITKIVVNIKI